MGWQRARRNWAPRLRHVEPPAPAVAPVVAGLRERDHLIARLEHRHGETAANRADRFRRGHDSHQTFATEKRSRINGLGSLQMF